MDCLRNDTAPAVDYIEGLLFYILRMSDFCYLHPSTPACQRMVIDFCHRLMAGECEIKNKKTKKRDGGGEGLRNVVLTKDLKRDGATGLGWLP